MLLGLLVAASILRCITRRRTTNRTRYAALASVNPRGAAETLSRTVMLASHPKIITDAQEGAA